MKTSARPFAVFDIDGTLIRWQLYHAVSDRLAKHGIINQEEYKAVLEARLSWKNRRTSNSFNDYEEFLISLIDKSVPGINHEQFVEICTEVVERYRDQVYTYTRDLINQLKEDNYLIFAISASPSEIVSMVSQYYQFDDFGASSYEVLNGRLSGKHLVLNGTAKPKKLKELVEKHGASFKGSIGVGDTEGDIKMLSCVERPIAFNPSMKLFETASIKGWEIVVERKNVIYELNYTHGQYLLATTN